MCSATLKPLLAPVYTEVNDEGCTGVPMWYMRDLPRSARVGRDKSVTWPTSRLLTTKASSGNSAGENRRLRMYRHGSIKDDDRDERSTTRD